MTSKRPPIPPANRSDKGPGGEAKAKDASDVANAGATHDDRTGRQANIKQNTTHQGYQQDR